jgi:hypothetical protein
MALQLYRRHRKECKAGHPEDSKSGQFEEGRFRYAPAPLLPRKPCSQPSTGSLLLRHSGLLLLRP